MRITLSHGNGAAEGRQLVETVFMSEFINPVSQDMEDAATLSVEIGKGRLAFTTDSYVVKPLFFPGGDIGRLAVAGTVNDLLTSGAKPLALSAAFVIEEGMTTETLGRVAKSMRECANEAGVQIVTGDTKVIEGAGGLYINTSGIGVTGERIVGARQIKAGDVIIVSGTLGDHHACIVSERMGIKNGIRSDAAPLVGMVGAIMKSGIGLSCMRDITRGGLATVLDELSGAAGLCAVIDEAALPVDPRLAALCGILGLEPLYMGNEGKMLFVLPADCANDALELIKASDYGQRACVIGRFTGDAYDGGVLLKTASGGLRIVAALSGEGLPRIC